MEKEEKNLNNYRLIISLILIILIFILSIIIVSTYGTIKSKSKKLNELKQSKNLFSKSFSAISAVFSFEIIFMFVYLILMIILKCYSRYENYLSKVMLFILIICHFLYLINLVIIPAYFQEFKFLIKSLINESNSIEKELNNIKSYYVGLIAISYIFLFIVLFFDFILLNLYKNIFFNSFVCLTFLIEIFFQGFYEKADIKELEKLMKKRKKLTQEIRQLLDEQLNKEIIMKKEEINTRFK